MRRKPRARAYVVARSDQDLEGLLLLYLARADGAFDAVSAMAAYDPDQCWRFLEIARRSGLSDEQLAFLAAGPFEALMKRYGGDCIDRVEAAARVDHGMRVLVAAVWQAGMSDALWARIVALRAALGIQAL